LNYEWHSMQDITYFNEHILGRYISLMDKLGENGAAYINEVRDAALDLHILS
jgi:hypothetical protein